MIPAPHCLLSQVWIFHSPILLFQQESDIRRVRFMDLKMDLKVPVAGGLQRRPTERKKMENQIFQCLADVAGIPWYSGAVPNRR
jgi:hypothetical protein